MAIYSNTHNIESELARTEARLTHTAQVIAELRSDLITVYSTLEIVEREMSERIALIERANTH